MNILLLNHYAGSPEMGMEFRPYYFAREWIKMGHHVKIVAGDYSHLRNINPSVKQDFQKDDIDGIDYCWIKTGDYKGNGARRAFTMFRFVGKLWLNAGKIAREWRPDVVIASSTYPLDTYAAQRIAKKSGAKLIHEVHDMWPISPIELGGMSEKHPFIILMQMAENSFCKHSDYVVSLLPGAKEHFIEHGMRESKFVHISNGIVEEEWKESEALPKEHKKLLERLKKEHKFIICFFGSHTNGYALPYLIKAVQELDNPHICAVFVGKGSEKESLIKLTQSSKEKIFFCPPVPKKAVPELLKYADLLYVGATHNKIFRFGICMNKLFDSMMSGKPILYAVDAPNNYITDYECGISITSENISELKKGIMKIYSLSDNERLSMGKRGHDAVVQNFTYPQLAKKFEVLFKEIKNETKIIEKDS